MQYEPKHDATQGAPQELFPQAGPLPGSPFSAQALEQQDTHVEAMPLPRVL